MIDYEKEAREFKLIGIAAYNSAGAGAESRAMSDWLRSHDARVLREAAMTVFNDADFARFRLNGHASEIEAGK